MSSQESSNLVHKLGFTLDEKYTKKNKNNFLMATLHFLTNINFFQNFTKEKNIGENILFNAFKELFEKINSNNNEKVCSIDNFADIIFNKIKDKANYNPKFLINTLLTEFNLFFSKEFNDASISNNFFITIQDIKKCKKCKNYIEEKKEEKKFLIYNIYDLYKNKKENYNIYDCFESYLKQKNNEIDLECKNCKEKTKHEIKTIFNNLPNNLIIFVDYGQDNTFKFEGEFTFNEELEFNNEYVETKFQNTKYYLSSIIIANHIMKKNENYHTFCRGEKDDNYFCYNGEFVHEVVKIDGKMQKNNIDLNEKKERFIYALLYSKYS